MKTRSVYRKRRTRKTRRIEILRGFVIFLALAYGSILLCGFLISRKAGGKGNAVWQFLKINKEMQGILDNGDAYPEELLDMLSRNPDMLEFVQNYPERRGCVYADSVGEVTKGEIPFLLQWDNRWGYGNYGSSCIAVSGCAPTVLSMVITGLTGDDSVTPYTVAKYADENGYYVPGIGTSWSLITDGCEHFGVHSRELALSKDTIFQTLDMGKPIICSVGPGDFTTTGHFIVLIKTEDGKIKLYDPNSKERSEKLWDYETLETQISNLWSVSL